MPEIGFSSRVDQVAECLREGIRAGRWQGMLPGRLRLAGQLGVSDSTVAEALRQLGREGWLESQGPGRRRRIVLPQGEAVARTRRIRILLYENHDWALPDHVELVGKLQLAGYAAETADKCQHDLGMCRQRIARFVQKTPADAWIVHSGSHEILEWFASQAFPAFALFGCFTGLPIAGVAPEKAPAMIDAVRKLVALGHRRIVMLSREEHRKPSPAPFERDFLDELARLGIATGSYNLPDWEETRAGLHAALDRLFRYTPPTALILDEPDILQATQQFLARRMIRVPEKVSLLCSDPDRTFKWCDPPIAHIRWDFRPAVRRAIRWADNISRGKNDKRQSGYAAELVEGGTLGPAPKET